MGLIAALLGGLATITGSLVGRVLLALGMSFVTYKGLDTGIGWILTEIKANVAAMPVQIVNFFAWLWVDKAISMVFSAHAAAMVIKLAGSADLTKLVTKG